MQRRIRNRDPHPREQFADFAQAYALSQPPLNGLALIHAATPGVASRTSSARLECQQDLADVRLGEHRPELQPEAGPDRDVVPHRFRIKPQLGGDALFRRPAQPQPQRLRDFEHRDLAIHPGLLLRPLRGPKQEACYARSGRGERF